MSRILLTNKLLLIDCDWLRCLGRRPIRRERKRRRPGAVILDLKSFLFDSFFHSAQNRIHHSYDVIICITTPNMFLQVFHTLHVTMHESSFSGSRRGILPNLAFLLQSISHKFDALLKNVGLFHLSAASCVQNSSPIRSSFPTTVLEKQVSQLVQPAVDFGTARFFQKQLSRLKKWFPIIVAKIV